MRLVFLMFLESLDVRVLHAKLLVWLSITSARLRVLYVKKYVKHTRTFDSADALLSLLSKLTAGDASGTFNMPGKNSEAETRPGSPGSLTIDYLRSN